MDAKTCLEKMKLAGVLAMATVDAEGAPQIRNVSAVHYEEDSLYFFTAKGKEMTAQLRRDGRLQALVHTRFNEMIRLSGVANELENPREQIDTIFAEQPYLGNVYPGDTRYSAGTIFEVSQIVIDYFNLGVHPIDREVFEVSAPAKPKGYVISDSCIACGTCQANCPQNCIESGDIMRIQPEHCLHCGNCYNVCPVQAVERL